MANCLQNNIKLVLVIDENKPESAPWREMYDPDLSHIINAQAQPLPTQVLKHSDLEGHLDGIVSDPVSF